MVCWPFTTSFHLLLPRILTAFYLFVVGEQNRSFKAHKKLVTFQLNAGNEGKCIEHFQALLSFTHERNGITETSLLNSVMSILDSIPNRPISAALHESALSLIKLLATRYNKPFCTDNFVIFLCYSY